MSNGDSCCGNIYKDMLHFEGKSYAGYTADCLACGVEIVLEASRWKRCKTILREKGWVKVNGKWMCNKCDAKQKADHESELAREGREELDRQGGLDDDCGG